jgi:nicotinate-nucleotide--dimethylbenzimidazole phosphoribosyltransferase
MIMSYLCEIELEDCVGRGTGLNDAQLENKLYKLKEAKNLHLDISDPLDVLSAVGGFEIAQMTGGILTAYKKNMIILVDGFIASSAFLVAYKMNPDIIKNAIFCHMSEEKGHQKMLSYLGVKPLLNLDMRLGEGTGCAVAYPIIQSAVNFLNEMASFESAGVTNKDEV